MLLALPRGGIPVGYEVARALGVPLEVLLTRRHRAAGRSVDRDLGAVAEGGSVVVNGEVVRARGLRPTRSATWPRRPRRS